MAGSAKMGTGTSAGSGGTSGVASVATNTGAQMGVTSASLSSGSSASGLRKRASSTGSGSQSPCMFYVITPSTNLPLCCTDNFCCPLLLRHMTVA